MNVDMLFGIGKIVVMALMGGLLAIIGDNVGRFFGKRRFRFFKLRPRYTSMIFTGITGALISIFSITIMASLSSDVRIYLFSMERIKQELVHLKEERSRLLEEVNFLNNVLSSGQLLYPVNAPIVVVSLRGVDDLKRFREMLEKVVRERVLTVSNLLGKPLPEDYLKSPVELDEDEYNRLQEALRGGSRYVAIAYSKRNTFLGDKVLVGVKFTEDKVVFRRGEVVLKLRVDGSAPLQDILSQLLAALPLIQGAAMKRGKLPLPQVGGFGGTVDPVELLLAAERIKRLGREVCISFIITRDVYMADEFSLRLEVQPCSEGGKRSEERGVDSEGERASSSRDGTEG